MGGNVYSGRVEVCQSQQWGTVCGTGWGNSDASVLCAQLGYSRLSEYHKFMK